jgi:predicted metal-binding membrane protein
VTSSNTAAAAARRLASPQTIAILLVAAGAWALTVPRAIEMGTAGGTMGMSLAAFLVMWSLMMAAMMLPAITSLTSLYVRTFGDHPWRRTLQLLFGYLAAWSVAGLPVFALARLADEADAEAMWPRFAAAAILAAAGAWQLTGAKDRCLRHCRSPVGLLLHYGNFRGRTRDVRVGVHHGLWCLGCCWALMMLFIAFGVMNLIAMVALAALIFAEKRWSQGERLARIAGFALIVLAVAVLFVPRIAPGLTNGGDDTMMLDDI